MGEGAREPNHRTRIFSSRPAIIACSQFQKPCGFMTRVCLSAPNSLTYPQGGHLWVFLNWALGFRSIGCEVVWLDVVPISMSVMELQSRLAYLRTLLSPFGIDSIAVDFITD